VSGDVVSSPQPVARNRVLRMSLPRPVVETVLVLLGTLVFACYLVWPLPQHLGEWIFGYPGDSTGTISYLWLMAHHEGFHVLGSNHIELWGAPFGYSEDSSVNLTLSLTFVPAYLLAELGHEIAAYNLIIITGFAFSGAAMYWLVRWLGVARSVAAWSAVVYMVFPWHLEKAQGHAAYVHLESFPLLLLALLAWRRRPDWRHGALVVAAYASAWLTAGYFGLVATVAVAVLGTVIAADQLRVRRTFVALIRPAALGAAVLAVPAILFAASALGSGASPAAPVRTIAELSVYGARPWEYILPSYRHPYFGAEVGPWLLARLHGSNFSETSIYVGWVTIALAALWLVLALVRRRELPRDHGFATVGLFAVLVAAVIFSLPSPIWDGGPPGPSRLLFELTPYFRVPTRFIAVVMAALVPLAALGLERLVVRFQRPLHRIIFVAVVAGLSFWELSFVPPRLLTDIGIRPPEYTAVKRTPPGVLAEYPLVGMEIGLNSEYLFQQRLHDRPLLNGAPKGTFSDSVRETLIGPGDPSTAPSLAALGVSAVVVHGEFYPGSGFPPPPENLGSGFKEVARYPDGARVFRVVAKPAPAHARYTTGFGSSEIAGPRTTARWLTTERGRIEFTTVQPGRYTARFPVAAYERPQELVVHGAEGRKVIQVPSTGGTAEIPISLPEGRSWVDVTASPGLRSIPDGRRVSVYVGNWAFVPPGPAGSELKPFRG
jgi:hypothetical protein